MNRYTRLSMELATVVPLIAVPQTIVCKDRRNRTQAALYTLIAVVSLLTKRYVI